MEAVILSAWLQKEKPAVNVEEC